jgi:flavodoxin
MNICICYESKYGNGKRCMEYLRDVLSKDGHEVALFSVREQDPSSLPEAEVYIFSAPTQIGNVAGKMKKFLKKAEFSNEGAKYALVTTCLDPQKTKSITAMEDLLSSKGVTKAADGLIIKVTGMKGPCEDGHEEQLRKFAKTVAGP